MKHIGLRLADKGTKADLSRGTIMNTTYMDEFVLTKPNRASKPKLKARKKRRKVYGRNKK